MGPSSLEISNNINKLHKRLSTHPRSVPNRCVCQVYASTLNHREFVRRTAEHRTKKSIRRFHVERRNLRYPDIDARFTRMANAISGKA